MFDFGDLPSRALRPHQKKAISMVWSSFRQSSRRRVVLQAPTGFGKSLVAARMICQARAKGHRVLFTVPRLSLVDQTVAEFEREGLSHIGVMQANHPRTDAMAPVQVATVQTLGRRLEDIGAFGLVIQDECHEQSDAVLGLMDRWRDTRFIGLSATPWARGMGLRWEDLCIAATTGDLIEAGYLSQFRVFAPSIPDLSGVKTVAGDYAEGGLEEVMSEGKLVAGVVETWLEKGEDRPTLVFGVNCNHAKRLYQQFTAAGVSAGYCDAYTDGVERRLLERRFRSGEVRVACSVRTLTTGVDWPVSCIVDAAPTKSFMLHVQRIGRGLRINPGTEDLIVLDHASNSLRLGLVTDIGFSSLDKTPKGARQEARTAEKLPKECGHCGALHTGLVCPFCGHERRPPPLSIETVDGELVEMRGKKAASREEKQRFWSMALHIDAERGKGGRLAKGLYKGKFDVWPAGLSDRPVPPDAAFLNYEKSRRIAYAKRMAKMRSA